MWAHVNTSDHTPTQTLVLMMVCNAPNHNLIYSPASLTHNLMRLWESSSVVRVVGDMVTLEQMPFLSFRLHPEAL